MTLTVTVAVCTIPGREALLDRAVASICAQTRLADEIIIEADPDRTGAGPARDRALARVATSHVAWVDDDDELLPTHLERLALVAETSGADVVYPWFECDPPSADNLRVRVGTSLRSPEGVEFSEQHRAALAAGWNFLHLTALFRTDALRKAGFPPLGARGSNEDAGAYQALALAGASFVHLPERTWIWHRRGGTAGRGRP